MEGGKQGGGVYPPKSVIVIMQQVSLLSLKVFFIPITINV